MTQVSRREIPCGINDCTALASRYRAVCWRHHSASARYNISDRQLIEYLNAECMACGSREKLSIDHDHNCCPQGGSCGKCVRGVLCGNCNLALGLLKDDPERLIALAAYLRA